MYEIPYEADFECENGHKFTAEISPATKDEAKTCPTCHRDWLDRNIPKGKRIGPTRFRSSEGVAFL